MDLLSWIDLQSATAGEPDRREPDAPRHVLDGG
jgi:hypothetical protein